MNSVNLLTIIFGISTIFGIILSIYFYRKTRKERKPIFVVDPFRVTVIKERNCKSNQYKIVDLKGNEIKSNITKVRLFFWNNGRESIKDKNILEGIKIKLLSKDSEILDFKILSTSRDICQFDLTRDPNDVSNTLKMNFFIIEYKDGVTIQITFKGDQLSELAVSGIIEGAKEIITSKRLRNVKTEPIYLDIIDHNYPNESVMNMIPKEIKPSKSSWWKFHVEEFN